MVYNVFSMVKPCIFGHLPWFTMVFHGNTIVFRDLPWFTMVFHDNTIVFGHLLWFTMVFHSNTVNFFYIYHGLQWFLVAML